MVTKPRRQQLLHFKFTFLVLSRLSTDCVERMESLLNTIGYSSYCLFGKHILMYGFAENTGLRRAELDDDELVMKERAMTTKVGGIKQRWWPSVRLSVCLLLHIPSSNMVRFEVCYYRTLIGSPMSEIKSTDQRGRMATRSGQIVLEAEQLIRR